MSSIAPPEYYSRISTDTAQTMEPPGCITPLLRCKTENATDLWIINLSYKLLNSGNYDIGGTYMDDNSTPEFWFYCVTALGPGKTYLISLFVLPRKPSNFTIMLPKLNNLKQFLNAREGPKMITSKATHAPYSFHTTKNDEHVYLKTFMFHLADIENYERVNLLLPIKIVKEDKFTLNNDYVRLIEQMQNFTTLLKNNVSTDYVLESKTNTKYNVHKVLLAASSTALRNMVRTNEHSLKLDIDDTAMKLFLEFLYFGTVKNLLDENSLILLDIAEKCELHSLSEWIQEVICRRINVNNALDIAVLAKKHNLKIMSDKAFDYIRVTPEVLDTEAFQKLDDIELVKSLLYFLHVTHKPAEQKPISYTEDDTDYRGGRTEQPPGASLLQVLRRNRIQHCF